MTRKDFELIAETIKFANVDEVSRAAIAHEFSRALIRTNSRFNAERFLRACEPQAAKKCA